MSGEDIERQYAFHLQDLLHPDYAKIKVLREVAIDHRHNASHIVAALTRHIYTVSIQTSRISMLE
jgi:hypothetical protein